jgi:hypothetical protein
MDRLDWDRYDLHVDMSAPTRSPRKPTDDPLFAVIEPALKVGAFAGKLNPDSPGNRHQFDPGTVFALQARESIIVHLTMRHTL